MKPITNPDVPAKKSLLKRLEMKTWGIIERNQ
jgi:hypothetical protein